MGSTVLDNISTGDKLTEAIQLSRNELNADKVFVIVEGSDDEKVYSFLMDTDKVLLFQAGSCSRVIEVLKQLNSNYLFCNKVFGIKDADFDHFLGNSYPEIDNLFLTDYHDMEMTFLSSDFEYFLKAEFKLSPDSLNFNKVLEDIKVLAYLRLYNQIEIADKGLDGITFKGIKHSKIYDGRNAIEMQACLDYIRSFGNDRLEYFPNVETMERFIQRFPHPEWKQLINGHDFLYSLAINLKVYKGCFYENLCLILRSKASFSVFRCTQLYLDINRWMIKQNLSIWRVS